MPGTWWDMYDTQLLHSTAHPSGNVGSKKIDTVDPRPSTVGRDLPDPLQSTHPWWLSGARVSHSSCDNISSPAARTVALATSFLIDTTYNLQPRRAPQSPPPPPPNAFFFVSSVLVFFCCGWFCLSSVVIPFVFRLSFCSLLFLSTSVVVVPFLFPMDFLCLLFFFFILCFTPSPLVCFTPPVSPCVLYVTVCSLFYP